MATNVQNKLYNAMVEQLQQLQKLNAALTKEISEERLNHQSIIQSLDDDKRKLYNYNRRRLTKTDEDVDYLDSPKPVQTSFRLMEDFFMDKMGNKEK